MTDEHAAQHPTPDGQHDTNVLSWPTAGLPADGSAYGPPQGASRPGVPGGVPGYGVPGYGAPGYGTPAYGSDFEASGTTPALGGGVPDGSGAGWSPAHVSNPEADYWAGRFRRQRLWTRLLAASIAAAVLLVVGGGLFVWKVVVPRAEASDARGLAGAVPDLGLPDSRTGGSAPDTTTPDGDTHDGGTPDGGAADPDQPDLSKVPLPDPLRGLGSALGIDNMEELLDRTVSMGLMTQEQADRIRAAVANGQSLEGLLGGLAGQFEPDPNNGLVGGTSLGGLGEVPAQSGDGASSGQSQA